MVNIEPFAALRPTPAMADRICELPYDAMSSAEARALAEDNPFSFLHVSKPEIDLPAGTDVHSPAVYAKGKENFQKLLSQGALTQDPRPCLYLYRQIMGRHTQIGLVAVVSCEDYLTGIVKRHELTHPDKEDDRVRHIEALDAQTGPAFLTYRAAADVDELMRRTVAGVPEVDFVAPDGVRHSSWTIADAGQIRLLQNAVGRMPVLYIADGHHRTAAASRIYLKRNGAGRSAWFLAVLFPHNQLQVLPYHRVLKDLNGHSAAELLAQLANVFAIRTPGTAAPDRKHQLGFYLQARWHTLTVKSRPDAAGDPVEELDVTLLQKQVLEPIFGIADPRTSDRIAFVGGIRGTGELERLVDGGEFACAFSLHPTRVEDLMRIADSGGLMPPKSTWFEPKLRDAMFCHMI